jgi:hypothetical protein
MPVHLIPRQLAQGSLTSAFVTFRGGPYVLACLCPAILLASAGCGAAINSSRNFSQPGSPDGREDESPAATVPARGDRAVSPKIIYNAHMDLVVESVSTTEHELTRLVKESGGYVAETDVMSVSHVRRTASWKVRVPVDRFDGFLSAVGKLGEMQRSKLDSQDVTQEYHDLEAQIANKQQEERRLLKLLAESTGKLTEVLTVEKELSRVRGEVEVMQGRLRYLANQTSLSTVTITATELRDYTPPVSPTFAAQIGRTFHDSLGLLTGFGKAVVLIVVALVPWLPVIAVAGLIIAWLARRSAVRHAP